MSKSLLGFDNVSFNYESGFRLDKVSFELCEGDFVSLVGPNGSGKTTLLKLAYGLLRPGSGQIRICGRPISDLSRSKIGQTIAVLEQETHYLYPFTVEEIVLMGRFPHRAGSWWETEEDVNVAHWALRKTHTEEFRERSIYNLSGGERRRVEIARALAQQCSVMLLDEPNAFLDPRQKREVFALLRTLNRDHGIAILMVTHDIELALSFTKRTIFVKDGLLQNDGPATELLREDSVEKLFDLSGVAY